AAARRTDEGGDAPVVDREVDVLERAVTAVEELKILDGDFLDEVAVGGTRRAQRDAAELRRRGRDRGHLGCLVHRRAHLATDVREVSKRATMLRRRMATVITSAPAQARCCQSS